MGGIPLADLARLRGVDLSESVRTEIDGDARRAAYRIIQGKRATYYGIGSAIAGVVDVTLHDQRSILTVCAPTSQVAGVDDVTLALPRLVGAAAVAETSPLPLDDTETSLLRDSTRVIRDAVDELGRED